MKKLFVFWTATISSKHLGSMSILVHVLVIDIVVKMHRILNNSLKYQY